jgi:DNA adenine methylase
MHGRALNLRTNRALRLTRMFLTLPHQGAIYLTSLTSAVQFELAHSKHPSKRMDAVLKETSRTEQLSISDDFTNGLAPFLRWAGGKRKLVPRLLRALPTDFSRRRYCEPFVGAGALFLAICPRSARLSDANAHLMDCYSAIRTQPETVARYLRQHSKSSSEDYYYSVREQYNRPQLPSSAQAARFIYLNRTCFNGIFRVNRNGAFNVPYGFKEPPPVPSHAELRKVSEVLRHAELRTVGFEQALSGLGADDFAYLDPPYPPINGTAYFTHYTADRFSEENQNQLADCVLRLNKRGAAFMMSNADTPLIRRLYGGFQLVPLSVTRFITCKAAKYQAAEVLITNYPVRLTAND